MFRAREVYVLAEVALDLCFDVGNLLDEREFIDRLRVVCDGAVRVNGNRHRPHAKKTEGDETEGEDRRGDHQYVETKRAEDVGDGHQSDDADAEPVSGEITGDEARQDVQGWAALLRRGDDLFDVARSG